MNDDTDFLLPEIRMMDRIESAMKKEVNRKKKYSKDKVLSRKRNKIAKKSRKKNRSNR